jgi:hypothetical protein
MSESWSRMGFLKRLLGGNDKPDDGDVGQKSAAIAPADLDAAERERELELMRGEQARLDELTQRQLRYAKYAWEPPAQGGERRADDEDVTAGT